MCQKRTPQSPSRMAVNEAISYTIPRLYVGKENYIGFYAYDPSTGTLRRKKIKMNHIKSMKERRDVSRDIIKRLTFKLTSGWNPWIEAEQGSSYVLFEEVCDKFISYQDKMYMNGLIEKDSRRTFTSNMNIIQIYNQKRLIPIRYIYQFDKQFINDFMDYLMDVRNVIPRTRDNYLAFCKKFVSWCCEKDYLKTKVSEGIRPMGKKARKAKKRTILSQQDFSMLCKYLYETDKHYLLAVYLTYYCCIRPKELSLLRIMYFNLKKQTLFIPGQISKNDKDGVVTVPDHVLKLMIELGIFEKDPDYYLFSTGFCPGLNKVHQDQFRKRWIRTIVPTLNFPPEYQFYSLKDTGITNMLHNHIDPLSVRDQARHYSLEMTNTYTPSEIKEANPILKKYK